MAARAPGSGHDDGGLDDWRRAGLGPGRGLLPGLPRSLRGQLPGPQAGTAGAVGRAALDPRLQGRRPPGPGGAARRARGPGNHRDLPQPDLHGGVQPSLQRLRLPRGRSAPRRRGRPPRAPRRRPWAGYPGHPRRGLQSRRAGLVALPPSRGWFFLDGGVLEGREPVPAYGDEAPRGYRAWWGSPGLPKLRVDHPEVRAHLMAVAEHWIRFGIDGWRLHVPQDIEDPTFWPEFRRRVRTLNPEAYLLGEIWEEAPEWVTGDRFDAVMNYPLGIAILGFVGAGAIDHAVIAPQSNYRRELRPLDGPGFAAALERLGHTYPPDVAAVQFNLLGSHDTPRAVTVMGGDAARLPLASVLQMALPGAPSIYSRRSE